MNEKTMFLSAAIAAIGSGLSICFILPQFKFYDEDVKKDLHNLNRRYIIMFVAMMIMYFTKG